MKSNVEVDERELRPSERVDHALAQELVSLLRQRLSAYSSLFMVKPWAIGGELMRTTYLELFVHSKRGLNYLGLIKIGTDRLKVSTFAGGMYTMSTSSSYRTAHLNRAWSVCVLR